MVWWVAVGYGAAAKAVSTAEAEQKRLTICEPFLFEGYRTAEQPTASFACRTAQKIIIFLFNHCVIILQGFYIAFAFGIVNGFNSFDCCKCTGQGRDVRNFVF